MRSLLLGSLFIGGALVFVPASSGNQQPTVHLVAEDNVNSRYTVESIEVAGEAQPELPPSLKQRLASLIGARFDPAQFDELAREIRKELHLRSVKPHLLRGSSPDRVRVQLITERRSVEFDVSVPKFLYYSSQGWSAEAQASTTIARTNVLRFGVVSDGDALAERFAGINAAYENLHTGSSRIQTAFLVEDFHDQWDGTAIAADGPKGADLYRARRNFQPEAIFLIAKPLTVTFGASFEQIDMEAPGSLERNADAFVAGVHYGKQLEASADSVLLGNQQIEAGYTLRLAGHGLGGDYRYSRHRGNVRYSVILGRSTISDQAIAGVLSGDAPLYERFVVGTSSLLRGWDRSEIDPLGGNRLLHNSVDYSFLLNPGGKHLRSLQVFYDAGAVWNAGQTAPVRQSAGIGYRQSVFSLALAFPLRDGHIDPVFMVGMNY
jgi:hypothetical protein